MYDDVAEEVTLMMTARKAGRLVAFVGYAMSFACPKVPLRETS